MLETAETPLAPSWLTNTRRTEIKSNFSTTSPPRGERMSGTWIEQSSTRRIREGSILKRSQSEVYSVSGGGHYQSKSNWDFVQCRPSALKQSPKVGFLSDGRWGRTVDTGDCSMRHSPDRIGGDCNPSRHRRSMSVNERCSPVDLGRIQFEQSKKLIPMIQSKQSGRRKLSKSPTVGHSLGRKISVYAPATQPHTETRDTDLERSKENDRNTFYKSLKNKSRNENRCKHAKKSEEVPVVPPSLEEERFLRSLGWSDTDEIDLLTEEEIAEFKTGSKRRSRLSQSSPISHLEGINI